ncbi:Bpu10I family restriction endonuclease [Akkermansiaceae bacterium]|nr:Bpu10I family restriction endonuclease [Akkermansiaceae bacterium]
MKYIHGSKLERKAASNDDLAKPLEYYNEWKNGSEAIEGRTPADIKKLTELLEIYKSNVESVFDQRNNSAQEVLQSSIIEEFFEYLFCYLERDVKSGLELGSASGFIDLAFNPKDVNALVDKPDFTIRKKDHDFVIGATVRMTLKAATSDETEEATIVVPAVAIECKRYLERNMLDECSGTAEKVKKATPYCLYIVVAEYLKMDHASPEISLIDEIYILRKQRNSDRLSADFTPNPIDDTLIWEIYDGTLRHLQKVWWNPDSALTNGRAFGRPSFP